MSGLKCPGAIAASDAGVIVPVPVGGTVPATAVESVECFRELSQQPSNVGEGERVQ